MEQKTAAEHTNAYAKRPMWQWILLYVVIAIVVYGLFYYLILRKQPSYTNQTSSLQQTPIAQNSVYKMTPKEKIGNVVTDMKGMTLYTYAKDTSGTSACTDACLTAWPAYTAPSKTGNLPANISVIQRADGTLQYAWKNMPLYYYAKDGDAGDAYGNGVGGVWSVVK